MPQFSSHGTDDSIPIESAVALPSAPPTKALRAAGPARTTKCEILAFNRASRPRLRRRRIREPGDQRVHEPNAGRYG